MVKKRSTLKRNMVMKEVEFNFDNTTDIIEEDRLDIDVGMKEEDATEK